MSMSSNRGENTSSDAEVTPNVDDLFTSLNRAVRTSDEQTIRAKLSSIPKAVELKSEDRA